MRQFKVSVRSVSRVRVRVTVRIRIRVRARLELGLGLGLGASHRMQVYWIRTWALYVLHIGYIWARNGLDTGRLPLSVPLPLPYRLE